MVQALDKGRLVEFLINSWFCKVKILWRWW